MQMINDSTLLAYIEESLPAELMARIEATLREDGASRLGQLNRCRRQISPTECIPLSRRAIT